MIHHKQCLFAALAAVVFVSQAAAAPVPLGSAWEAIWDSSLDPFVDITVNEETDDTLYIQKSAEFTQGPGLGGLFPSIPIVFRQVAPSNVTRIVICDEIITNSTGHEWTGFDFDLLDGGDALFYSGPDFFFSTSPLDNQAFGPDGQSFRVDGYGLGPGGTDAVVAAGSVWFPGDGAWDGDLIIEVVSNDQAPFTVFTLKETPTPEPATLAFLAAGGLALMRRMRRQANMRKASTGKPHEA